MPTLPSLLYASPSARARAWAASSPPWLRLLLLPLRAIADARASLAGGRPSGGAAHPPAAPWHSETRIRDSETRIRAASR